MKKNVVTTDHVEPIVETSFRSLGKHRLLKWVRFIIGMLLLLVGGFILVTNLMAMRRLNIVYQVDVPAINIPTDSASIKRGKHLVVAVSRCSNCHKEDFGGSTIVDDPLIGVIDTVNLTSGLGGIGQQYTDEDWVRAILHGVGPDGRLLIGMPSQYFWYYPNEDIGAMVAYLKSLPPVDREYLETKPSVLGRTLFTLGFFGKMSSEIIDHDASRPEPPPVGITTDYGDYLTTVAACHVCHGENLAGGRGTRLEPWAHNLTSGGELSGWTRDDFFTLMRDGTSPSGREMHFIMPWEWYGQMTDNELEAIWVYLQFLPALPTNEG